MYPDFLCIGAMKAGSSWLYQNIKQHPDVWMPPRKEIHFFDDILPLPLLVSLTNPRTFRQRKALIRHLLKPRNQKDIQDREWLLRLLLLPRTDRWYESLFLPEEGQISGDITPTYAAIKESRVAKVKALMPDVKIIYLLRNPVHRAWSQTAMHFDRWRGQGLQETTDKQIRGYLKRGSHYRHSDYMGNLRTWEHFFPRHQFHIGFFDRFVQDPREFLRDIYRFLELDSSDRFIPRAVHEKRNPGRYPAVPDRFAHYLATQYLEQTERLHQRFDNQYTAEWLDYVKQYM